MLRQMEGGTLAHDHKEMQDQTGDVLERGGATLGDAPCDVCRGTKGAARGSPVGVSAGCAREAAGARVRARGGFRRPRHRAARRSGHRWPMGREAMCRAVRQALRKLCPHGGRKVGTHLDRSVMGP